MVAMFLSLLGGQIAVCPRLNVVWRPKSAQKHSVLIMRTQWVSPHSLDTTSQETIKSEHSEHDYSPKTSGLIPHTFGEYFTEIPAQMQSAR